MTQRFCLYPTVMLRPPLCAFRPAQNQGLTLVHFSAQRKRFLWDGGVASWGLFGGRLGGVMGYYGAFGV